MFATTYSPQYNSNAPNIFFYSDIVGLKCKATNMYNLFSVILQYVYKDVKNKISTNLNKFSNLKVNRGNLLFLSFSTLCDEISILFSEMKVSFSVHFPSSNDLSLR